MCHHISLCMYVCMYVQILQFYARDFRQEYFSFTKTLSPSHWWKKYFSAYFLQNDSSDIKIENKVTQLHPATLMLFRFCSDVSH